MAQEELKEWQRPNSDFIKKYVAKHKQELEELRAKAKKLAFHGQWVIIGDEGYLKKSEQYATSSCLDEHIEGEVSPRIILSPSAESEKKGDEDIKKAIRLCRELKMKIAVRTGGHQYCGFSSTLPVNMQIDLSKTFPQHEYNAETNVLRCGVSQPLGEWAVKNHAQGIYLPMGVCPTVHLGGHVHTGGWGMVARSHGSGRSRASVRHYTCQRREGANRAAKRGRQVRTTTTCTTRCWGEAKEEISGS